MGYLQKNTNSTHGLRDIEKFYTIPTSMINTVKPPSATNSRKRPPPISYHLFNTRKFSHSKPYNQIRTTRKTTISHKRPRPLFALMFVQFFIVFYLMRPLDTDCVFCLFIVCATLLRVYEEFSVTTGTYFFTCILTVEIARNKLSRVKKQMRRDLFLEEILCGAIPVIIYCILHI